MFQEVTAHNFMRFKEVTLPLENQGLVLILGRNEDAEHAGSNGAGKALALDTKVLTSQGWSTIGALQVGDEVYSPSGQLVPVIAKSEVWTDRPCYNITFDNREEVTCDENHLWQVTQARDRSLKTTKQLSKLVRWREPNTIPARRKQYNGHNWTIDCASPSLPQSNRRNRLDPNLSHKIVSIEKVPSVPTQCIQVGHPAGMFCITESQIPTHNSSLIDMLTWGVWGKTVRNLKHDAVINRTVGKNCHVQVKLLVDGAAYVIDRHRKCDYTDKPNDLLLTMDGEDITGASMDQTQQRIEALLGLDFPTFQCMMPGAGLKAAEMTDATIKELLEKLLRTEAMATAHQLAKDKAKQLKANLETLVDSRRALDVEVAQVTLKQQDYHERAQSAYSDKVLALLALSQRNADLQDQIRAEEELVAQGEEARAERDLKAPVTQELLKSMEEADTLLKKSTALHESNRSTYNHAVLSADRDLQRCDGEIKSLATHCSHCGQQIPEDKFQGVLTKLEEKRAYLVEEAARNLREFEDWQKESLALLALVKADRDEKATAALTASVELDVLTEASRASLASEKVLPALRDSLAQVVLDTKSKENEVSPYLALNTEALATIEALRAKEVTLVEKIGTTEALLAQYAFWVDGFSAKGLRSHMLKIVAPILNTAAAKYSEVVTGGEIEVLFSTTKTLKSGDEREEFSIQVTTEDGADSYTGCSAGEKARVDLIIAFALGDLAQRRARKQIPFRFLDEPFESIDEEGNEAILSLLKSQKDYNTVYCITHKQSFQQLFNKHLCVVKSGGESKLEFS